MPAVEAAARQVAGPIIFLGQNLDEGETGRRIPSYRATPQW
jgi:hypothetical protein